MQVIDLTTDADDDKLLDLVNNDDERVELIQDQSSSKTILSSKNASQHTDKSALRNLCPPSSSGSHGTAQANRSSAWSKPAQQQSAAKGFHHGPGQQARAGSEAPAREPGTASKAIHQHPFLSTAVNPALPSGSIGVKSIPPSASTGAQTSLPLPAVSPLATLRQQQQPAAQHEANAQPITKYAAASSQQQAPASDDAHPAASSPGRGMQHPPPLLRDLYAQHQAAAKTQATAGQDAQQIVQGAQQAAQAHSASPMEQLAQGEIASRQTAQSQETKGECFSRC